MKAYRRAQFFKSAIFCMTTVFGLLFCFSLTGKADVSYTNVNVSTAEELKNELENGDLKKIKLTADIQQSPYYKFEVQSSTDMVLDLNGHKLDYNGKGYLRVEGKLRVIDSSNAKNGQITNCSEDRQGIFVSSGGECILDSGKITGNIVTKNYSIGEDSRANGAGVYVKSGGTFTMNGGEISNNSHFSYGGGVFNNGTFNLHGGTIRNNSSGRDAGGVYNASSGQFYMDGGYITGNSSSHYGGGIYNCNECSFLGGEISNNTATECGGAYFGVSGSDTYMSGNPVIRNNVIGGSITNGVLSGGTSSNLYFYSGNCITVTGPLTGNSGSISVGLSSQTMFYDYEIDHGDYFARGSDSYTLKSSDLRVFTPEESGLNVYFNSEKKIGTIMSEWTRFCEKAFNASKDPDHPTVITLDKDYVSIADSDFPLHIDGRKYVILDLNGHKLSRSSSTNTRTLVDVQGNLTIKDSKTGGCIDGSGRGIAADSSVNVAENGVLTMKSGSICGNTSKTCYGGGVNIMPNGSFVMEGGKIYGNSAQYGGGVYVQQNGTFSITGGTITGNNAFDKGGGVFSKSKIFLSGTPIIRDNTADQTKNNVCMELAEDCVYLIVDGTLTSSAKIGINMPSNDMEMLVVEAADSYNSGILTSTDINAFFSDRSNQSLLSKNGKVYLRSAFEVSFDSKGGSAVSKQLIDANGRVSKPSDPVWTDHIFAGWYEVDSDTLFDFDTIVKGDISLEARWADCSVSFADHEYGSEAVSPVVTKPDGSGTVSYIYYTDEDCSTMTGSLNGASDDGGVPKKAGTYYGKALIAASANYGTGVAISSFTISRKEVTIVSVTGVGRNYQPNNLVVGLTGGSIDGKVEGDSLDIDFSNAVGTMEDPYVDTDKAVTVTGMRLQGADAENYTLKAQPAGVKVTISRAENPVIVTPTASVCAEGKSIDMSNNVDLNGASGTVTYSISENSIGCSLNGSVLTSGMETGSVTVSVSVAQDANYLESARKDITVTVIERPTYPVTVVNGSGGGSFKDDVTVTVSANSAEKGREFDKWESDDVVFSDENAETSTFTMPEKAVTVTATYRDCTHRNMTFHGGTPATCTKGGQIDYWTCDNCEHCFTNDEMKKEIVSGDISIPPLGHDYAVSYEWSTDGHSCTAVAVCQRDDCDVTTQGHKVSETVIFEASESASMIKSVVKMDSSIDAMGVTTYTATFSNPLFKQQSVDMTDIPKKHKGDKIEAAKEKAEVVITSDSSKKPTVEYKASTGTKAKTVSVPATVTVNGVKYAVTSVSDSAFAGCKKATTIVIGSNVTKISNNAFKGVKAKVIKIKSTKITSKSLGKKAFKYLGKNVTLRVPKKKLKAYTKLFRKKGLSKKVKIKKL